MSLYLILNLASLSVPLAFSFHPKIRFYKRWKAFFPSMVISLAIYIIWDILFTKEGVWGFNHQYVTGTHILGLPLEEWLFFICIPYASVFTHYTLTSLYPGFELRDSASKLISFSLLVALSFMAMVYPDKAYTLVNSLFAVVILLLTMFLKPGILPKFYLSFLVILIPFFVVNGILTGSFIEEEVVWYNNAENLSFRVFTIPIEDFFYAFGLLLLNVLLAEVFSKQITIPDSEAELTQ